MRKEKKDPEKRLVEIKRSLGDFDLALPGTLRTLFMKCGKTGCACQTDAKARHGPYHLWDRKVGRKLSSKMVSKNDLKKIQAGIEERKKLEAMIAEVINLSQEIATAKIDQRKGGKN